MNYQDVRVNGIQTGLTAIGRAIIVLQTGSKATETREVLVLEMDRDYMSVLFPDTRFWKRIEWRNIQSAEVELW